ncbi:histidine kinase N-terminal domain-containing protein [Pectinatus haikarae]|uniref:histidine kinase n=1 Tax=Pectinatus haikarae TaxID=349096 RepID=A0ABT9Y4L0_9FIRM|nr:histidine kinase N-terminal domain-containing protein [Pectinatus haikarae]MDQ0202762.1 two-component sensor histidine kinase [Pectinatus haikarae]
MTDNNLLELCRTNTNLTAMQINLLQRIKMALPFTADLVMANIGLYVYAKQKTEFLIIDHIKPHTAYTPFKHSKAGRLRKIQEEPLIKYTIETGKSMSGKREWSWGKFIEMHTEAIFDSSGIVAVASFEMQPGVSKVEGYSYLYRTACSLLTYSHKNLDAYMFRALTSSDGIIIADKNNRIVFANTAAMRIYNILGVINLIGYHLFDHQLSRRITKETISIDKPYEKELTADSITIVRRDIPIKVGGSLLYRIIIVSDVTEVRKKDKELLIKSAVIQEIHHRVKNNLQTIASLLRLQARRSQSQEVKAALKESVNRILSISVVHEFLSQQQEEIIDVTKVTRNILNLISQNMLPPDFKLTTKFSGGTVILPSQQASNLALIVNELILNSLEHAFENTASGTIGLTITKTREKYILDLYDDGPGLPIGFEKRQSRSLGLQIVRTLIEDDMDGKFELYNNNGTHARITIPRDIRGE